ncbi:MAG: TM2 domain-containing protein [Paludibacteraceae bacterium]|nr:TM2 domain-containing protein [Paludibacteraceae bacterium]
MQDISAVNTWLAVNNQNLPQDKMESLRTSLVNCSESKWNMVRFLTFKEPNIMLLISFFAGYWGVERFMLGRKASGVLKLFVIQLSLIGEFVCLFLFLAEQTAWGTLSLLMFIVGFGWWVTDVCLVRGMTKEYNYNLIKNILTT